MSEQMYTELGPDWEPLRSSASSRARQARWRLAAGLAAAASLAILIFATYQVLGLPFGWWYPLRLWGIICIIAISLRHGGTALVSYLRHPDVPSLPGFLFLAAASAMAGLAYWKAIPLHGLIGIIPVAISVPLSIAASVAVVPLLLADAMNSVQTYVSRVEEMARRFAVTTKPERADRLSTSPNRDRVGLSSRLPGALAHRWHSGQNAEKATPLKQGLWLALTHQLPNQAASYGRQLCELHEEDVCAHVTRELGRRFSLRPRSVESSEWRLAPLDSAQVKLGSSMVAVCAFMVESGAERLWAGQRAGSHEQWLIAQVGSSFMAITPLHQR